jgi:hypothetical protein
MKRRMGTNGWILTGIGVVLALALADYVRATLVVPPSIPAPPKSPSAPTFSEGRPGPDFELPDGRGRPRRLSKLVRSEGLLSFVSDDARSQALMRYVARLAERRRAAHRPLPTFVTVADFSPAQERAFLSKTGLEQVVLYEAKDGPVSKQYHAEARPRCFQLVEHLGVAVLGSSPLDAPLFAIGEEILKGWSFRSPALMQSDFRGPEPDELRKFDPPAKPTSPSAPRP